MVKISIDMDSSFTNIYMLGSGMVLSEPTVAAVSADNKLNVKAVGYEARKLIGKTAENTKIVFPVFEGEIVNQKVAIELLLAFFAKIGIKSKLTNVHAIISVPCGASSEMLEKYYQVAKGVGINKISFIEAPILSAVGQRIPLSESRPCFVVDMASGVTNIGALSFDGIIAGLSVNFGSNKISMDIIDYIAEHYELQIGLLTAERIKKEIASLDDNDGLTTIVNGRDVNSGTPRSISLKAKDLIVPLKRYFDSIIEIAKSVLVKLPPEVSAEIRHAGIYLSGNACNVYGLEKYFNDKFNMKINVAEYPDMVVALGGGILLTKNDLVKKLSINFN